jgi:hypothetical protein
MHGRASDGNTLIGHVLFDLLFRLLAENSVTNLAASSESPISPPTRYTLITLAMLSFTVGTTASKRGFIGSFLPLGKSESICGFGCGEHLLPGWFPQQQS